MNKKFLSITGWCLAALAASANSREIKQTENIQIEVQQGQVPSLPFSVFVTYTDGTQAWRQTRWELCQRSDEELLTKKTVGESYTLKGYILGSDASGLGYPIEARVRVVAGSRVPALPIADPLPVAQVSLTGKNRLTSNAAMDVKQLLGLDITQQLYNYRDTYGLSTEGYTRSDGWDSPTTKLKGHGTGHYLSALAYAYHATPNRELRDSLLSRIRRMVNEMRECQERTFVWSDSLGRYFEARDLAPEAELRTLGGGWTDFERYKKDFRHYGYGYLNAIPAQHAALVEMYRPYNNESGVWAPYYSIHKQLAGLIDVANLIDDRTVAEKAAQIANDMGMWVWNRLHYRTFADSKGTREERRQRPGNRLEMWNMYIAGEVGGMAESLARLSEMAGDKQTKERFLEAAGYFDAPLFFAPLSRNIDDIRTRHANQHIPMVTGALRSYRSNHNPYYYQVARNFWHLVQGRYAYAMGGVGNGEMFRQPYAQMLSMNTNTMSDHERNMIPNPDMNETCCAYNLAKLTKELNCYTPDDASLMDYYERVLYNQIVGSLHPHQWACTYQYAVGLNAIKPFGNETPQSTCCGGTGVENHVKYAEAAYFHNDSTLWVALYLPSEAKYKGIMLHQQCAWPAESSRIELTGEADFALRLRVPYWADRGFRIRLNGKTIAKAPRPGSYFEIPYRHWRTGDFVEIEMPFAAHIFYGADKMELAATDKNQTSTPFAPQWLGAVMYGPLVMASTEIHTWAESEVNVSGKLKEIQLQGATADDGTGGPLYTLSLAGKRFLPDYAITGHATHYLRINHTDAVKGTRGQGIEKGTLAQVITLAEERLQRPTDWAPHGLQRLRNQLEIAKAFMLSENSQAAIDQAAGNLNIAINTMRPAHLAEPEDLTALYSLLTERKQRGNKTDKLHLAIQYAEMVVQYVNDGSGTPDMIEKALRQLKENKE